MIHYDKILEALQDSVARIERAFLPGGTFQSGVVDLLVETQRRLLDQVEALVQTTQPRVLESISVHENPFDENRTDIVRHVEAGWNNGDLALLRAFDAIDSGHGPTISARRSIMRFGNCEWQFPTSLFVSADAGKRITRLINSEGLGAADRTIARPFNRSEAVGLPVREPLAGFLLSSSPAITDMEMTSGINELTRFLDIDSAKHLQATFRGGIVKALRQLSGVRDVDQFLTDASYLAQLFDDRESLGRLSMRRREAGHWQEADVDYRTAREKFLDTKASLDVPGQIEGLESMVSAYSSRDLALPQKVLIGLSMLGEAYERTGRIEKAEAAYTEYMYQAMTRANMSDPIDAAPVVRTRRLLGRVAESLDVVNNSLLGPVDSWPPQLTHEVGLSHLEAGNTDVGMALLETSRTATIAKGSPHEHDSLRRMLQEQAGGLREAGFRELADSLDGTARSVPLSPPGKSRQPHVLAVRFPSLKAAGGPWQRDLERTNEHHRHRAESPRQEPSTVRGDTAPEDVPVEIDETHASQQPDQQDVKRHRRRARIEEPNALDVGLESGSESPDQAFEDPHAPRPDTPGDRDIHKFDIE